MPLSRSHDVVLFGATGFTGRLVAEHLVRNAPPECRLALAGRNRVKLEMLRERLLRLAPARTELPLLHADSDDPASLAALAAGTRVVATTVGPYLRYGEDLVAACAEAGTDYLDLTGEPEFVDAMYLKHHQTALRTGARLVHACGFDAVPADLGVLYTVNRLPEGVPLEVEGYLRVRASFSGGTLASVLEAMARGPKMAAVAKRRRRADPGPLDRRVRTPLGLIRRTDGMPGWALPLPTIDTAIVGRSAAGLDRYGPDFTFRYALALRALPTAVGAVAAAGALAAAAQVPPVRRWISGRVAPGQGPDPARRAASWFSLRLVGRGGGTTVRTEVRGGDPGYDETARILGESALCLAFDDLPKVAGQLTPSVAMGERLIERLERAGLTFRVAAVETPRG
ncbi:saccharopine dehydrogenase NADP-binding domain-containing protein [Streptomyces sp. OF3]|uniref:Saccharopine dehydrogenase NADP-binding domain-containing protein n=1 Tax=Streptomyces alkaliterrae TaxID=2213162 RepID=A0A7W3ZNC3_9ACTN|nr:saccharopine dehydrogenase NADP-binding domain-containing protein [Streptomyces alkaliterrae]MBB1254440.1 saccharopine dehydrogenase NADP-binding domain-containing protein [Streptomyces alkaliterrae]